MKTQVIDRGLAAAKQVKNTVTKVATTAGQVADIAGKLPASAAALQKKLEKITNPAALQKQVQAALPTAPTLQSLQQQVPTPQIPTIPTPQIPIPASPIGTMVGGGLDTKDKVVTGGLLALVLGGFVLHTGRSFWNAIQDVRSATDLPPFANA